MPVESARDRRAMFSKRDFGERVLIKPATGAPYLVEAIFEDLHRPEILAGRSDYSTTGPRIIGPVDDLNRVATTDQVVARGTTYRVTEINPETPDLLTIQLET